jgi:DNA repair exonuclease SbcCD ATPase subunit
MARKESRIARWERLVTEASVAIDELKEIQEEYQDWRDNLPENLESSTVADLLDAVCEIDFEGASAVLDESFYVELPRGFGRD